MSSQYLAHYIESGGLFQGLDETVQIAETVHAVQFVVLKQAIDETVQVGEDVGSVLSVAPVQRGGFFAVLYKQRLLTWLDD